MAVNGACHYVTIAQEADIDADQDLRRPHRTWHLPVGVRYPESLCKKAPIGGAGGVMDPLQHAAGRFSLTRLNGLIYEGTARGRP
jgi:hypothetical protein